MPLLSTPPSRRLWRVESPRLTARLGRLVGDLDTAEELAQDTFVAALEKWRADGIPNNPAAWLATTARFLAIDRIRRRDTGRDKYRTVAATTPETTDIDVERVSRPGRWPTTCSGWSSCPATRSSRRTRGRRSP